MERDGGEDAPGPSPSWPLWLRILGCGGTSTASRSRRTAARRRASGRTIDAAGHGRADGDHPPLRRRWPRPRRRSRRIAPDLLAGGRVLCSFCGPTVPATVLDAPAGGPAAGLLLYQRNLASEAEAARQRRQPRRRRRSARPFRLPAIIATDQEGGVVARIPGPPSDSAAAHGPRPPSDVEAEGAGHGRAAPPLGREHRPGPGGRRRPARHVRGPLPPLVRRTAGSPSPTASAFVAGLRAGGVAATLKHFPGLGAASANTDHADGVVTVAAG